MKYFFIFLFLINIPIFSQEETYQTKESHQEANKINKDNDYFNSKALGDFFGKRSPLKDDGLEILSTLTVDDTWNLGGGFKPTKKYGDGQWLYFLGLKFDLGKTFLKDTGGVFFIELQNKGGTNPSIQSIGSYNYVDSIEGPSGTQIYSCYYKHTFENGASLLIGKNDAYDYFSIMEHTKHFLNAGYENFATFEILPTYPYTAMGIVAYTPINSYSSFVAGIYDSSFIYDYPNLQKNIIGHFFNNLPDHAFLIAEFDFKWELAKDLVGTFGIGGWYNTAHFQNLENEYQRGVGGPYFTLDQTFYSKGHENAAIFCSFSATNPKIVPAQYYFCSGITWQGFSGFRPKDILGIGVSKCFFSTVPQAGFSKGIEASYEIFYVLDLNNGIYLQPDYQYVQYPGGAGIPSASVLTLRLNLDL